MRLLNLTGHTITLQLAGDRIVTLPPAGPAARVVEQVAAAEPVDHAGWQIPLATVRYGDRVLDLPTPEPGTAYVVSRVLAAAVLRADLYFPYPEIRDRGQIVAAGGLAAFDRESTQEAPC